MLLQHKNTALMPVPCIAKHTTHKRSLSALETHARTAIYYQCCHVSAYNAGTHHLAICACRVLCDAACTEPSRSHRNMLRIRTNKIATRLHNTPSRCLLPQTHLHKCLPPSSSGTELGFSIRAYLRRCLGPILGLLQCLQCPMLPSS